MPAGRPSIPYDPEIAEIICEKLATSLYGLEDVIESMNAEGIATPGLTTIYKWMAANPEFAESSARAREFRADTLADRMLVESNKPRLGEIVTVRTGEDGYSETKQADNVQRSTLHVQTIARRIGQLNPKKYADKQLHTGADGDSPVQFVVTRVGQKEK